MSRPALVRRVNAGTPLVHVTKEMNVSRPTARTWYGHYLADPDIDELRHRLGQLQLEGDLPKTSRV